MVLPGFYQNNKKNKFLFNQKPPGSPSTFHNTSDPFTDEFASLSLCITRVAIYERKTFITGVLYLCVIKISYSPEVRAPFPSLLSNLSPSLIVIA